MKRSFVRKFAILAVLALLISSFAVAAYAEDVDIKDIPHYTDGRINGMDITAPAAIYEYYDFLDVDDPADGTLNRIEFWGITSDGTVDKVLDVSAADILAADNSEGSVEIASNFSYSLVLEADDSLTLLAPNVDGSLYTFNWTLDFE